MARRRALLPLLSLALAGLGCDRGTRPAVPSLGSMEFLHASAAREVEAAHARLRAAPDEVTRWVELGRVLDRSDMRALSADVWRGAATLE